jgi:hypothetical protein
LFEADISSKQGDLIANLADLQADAGKKPSRYHVSTIVFERSNLSFPMKEKHDLQHRTLNITDSEKKTIS